MEAIVTVLEGVATFFLLVGGAVAALTLGALVAGARSGKEGSIVGTALLAGLGCFFLALVVLVVLQTRTP